MDGGDSAQFIQDMLHRELGNAIRLKNASVLSGGCINNARKIETTNGEYFLKWHGSIPSDMFEKEAMGLDLLHKTGNVAVPAVIGHGTIDNRHYLLLEFLNSTSQNRTYWEDLGRCLAEMHKKNQAHAYGLDHNNYIGRLPQTNQWHDDWHTFFIEERLEVQLLLAIRQGAVDSKFAGRYRDFYRKIPDLLPGDPPSLLHGDLWSGNVMTGPGGQACLIDPAVYYGHREIELAFTQMFGGFGEDFYHAYNETWPLEPEFDERVNIYNIYPSMVHVNLFGGSYLHGVQMVLKQYL